MEMRVTIFKKSSEMTNENLQYNIDRGVLERHDVSREEVLEKLPPQIRGVLELYSYWSKFPNNIEKMQYKNGLKLKKFNLNRLDSILSSIRAEDVYQRVLSDIPVDYDKLRQYIMTHEQMTDDSGEVVGLGFYKI